MPRLLRPLLLVGVGSLDGFSAPAQQKPPVLLSTRFSRPESGAMTSSPSVTIILVYVAAASYLIYWVGLMGIHLIAILYGWVALHASSSRFWRIKLEESGNVEKGEDKQRKASYQLWPMAPLVSTQRNQTTTNTTTQPNTGNKQAQQTNKCNKQTNTSVCTCFNQMQPLICQQFCSD